MPEGDVLAISLPRRGSNSPPAYASRIAIRQRFATASCIDTSTRWPTPNACRCHSAAITERRVDPGAGVADGRAGLEWGRAREAGHAHGAAGGLRDHVERLVVGVRSEERR